MKTNNSFWYKEFDINHILPENWKEELIQTAKNHSNQKELIPKSVTSREGENVKSIKVATVGGLKVKQKLPWLISLYKNEFLEYGQSCIDEQAFHAEDDRYAINLNFQFGTKMRYECHVDSNPLEGLLYVTDHPEGNGGELVVGLNKNATSVEEVDENCIRIYPKSGYLVFFDAREYPHYVTPLKSDDDVRVVVAMNFYTPSCPESSRPSDLNKHLGIE